jgi:hypothetical protein
MPQKRTEITKGAAGLPIKIDELTSLRKKMDDGDFADKIHPCKYCR